MTAHEWAALAAGVSLGLTLLPVAFHLGRQAGHDEAIRKVAEG